MVIHADGFVYYRVFPMLRPLETLVDYFRDHTRYMNPNHAPGGSPEGGQFTGGEGQSPDEMASSLSSGKFGKIDANRKDLENEAKSQGYEDADFADLSDDELASAFGDSLNNTRRKNRENGPSDDDEAVPIAEPSGEFTGGAGQSPDEMAAKLSGKNGVPAKSEHRNKLEDIARDQGYDDNDFENLSDEEMLSAFGGGLKNYDDPEIDDDESRNAKTGDHTHYARQPGIWAPGPNANWKLKSPDALAKSLPHAGKGQVAQHRNDSATKTAPEPKANTPLPKSNELKLPTQKDEVKSSPKDEVKSSPKNELAPQKRTTQLASRDELDASFPKASPTSAPSAEPAASAGKSASITPDTAQPVASTADQTGPKPDESPEPDSAEAGDEDLASNRPITKDGMKIYNELQHTKSGYPLAVMGMVKKFKPAIDVAKLDWKDLAQSASLRIGQQFSVTPPKDKENMAMTIASRSILMDIRKEETQKGGKGRKKQMDDEFEAAQPASSKEKGSVDTESVQEGVNSLPEKEKKVAIALMSGETGKAIASRLGVSPASVTRIQQKLAEMLGGDESKFRHAKPDDKDRYIHSIILPEIWQEILTQSRQYGIRAPEFIRSVMEAMEHSDGQYEAIIKGRQAFLGGMRYEYGPRHSPPKRIDGAVARLEALLEYADDIDEESLENEVHDIAREFDAADLKDIARKFGVKRGLATKMIALEKILEKVCAGKDDE